MRALIAGWIACLGLLAPPVRLPAGAVFFLDGLFHVRVVRELSLPYAGVRFDLRLLLRIGLYSRLPVGGQVLDQTSAHTVVDVPDLLGVLLLLLCEDEALTVAL